MMWWEVGVERTMLRQLPPVLALLCAVGTGLGWILARGEDTLLGLLLLVLEPLLWMGLCLLFVYAVRAKLLVLGTASLSSLAVLVLGLRVPAAAQEVDLTLPGPSPTTRSCAAHAQAPMRGVRVVSWNTNGALGQAHQELLNLQADLVVLQEVRGVDQLLDLQESLAQRDPGVEIGRLFVPAYQGIGTGVLLRGGWFGVCGQEQTEVWVSELPAQGGRRALSSLSFPVIKEVGLFPLLTVHADRPGSLVELAGWPQTLKGTGAQLARTAAALEEPSTVVIGDSNSHGTFRALNGRLRGAGLAWTGGGATWPARLGPFSMLPLYQLDRAWYGASWRVAQVRTQRLPGSDHLALVVDLLPTGVGG